MAKYIQSKTKVQIISWVGTCIVHERFSAQEIEDIKKELAVQDAMLSSCSVLSGSPMKVVFNHEGNVEEAAKAVLGAIGL